MLASMTATDVAFAMAGLMQAVLAVIWLLGALLVGDTRRAGVWWSAYAGFSAISFLMLTMALHAAPGSTELLRAGGNLLGIVAMFSLQRGVWQFVGRPMPWRMQGLGLAFVLGVSWFGLAPSLGFLRVSGNSLVLVLISVGIANDLRRHGRDEMHMRWPILLGSPVLLGAVGFGFRGLKALISPASVAAEMTTDSALNVGSALSYMVLSLAFHAMLVTLVVGRLLAELRHRSRHDGLTGLLNRRAMDEAIEAQVLRSRRNGETFTVLMLDLDHFKAINDRHGHAVGDRALKHAAARFRAGLREVDSLGRYGGEEFLALMPGAELAAAHPIADRLREQLAAQRMAFEDGAITLSVSIGVAQWHGDGDDATRLIGRADLALYDAKQQGRGRVIAAPPPKWAA